MPISLPDPYVVRGDVADGPGTQRNFQALAQAASVLPISTGRGAPTSTPSGRALYIRQDGGAGSTLYVWEGAAWAAK